MGPRRRGSAERTARTAAWALLLTFLAIGPSSAAPEDEARISLDVKDAEIVDIVRLLAEVGGFQMAFDPGVSCKLTLKLKQVRWRAALDTALRSCGLAYEGEDEVLRIAPVARLTSEQAERRRLEEERRLNRPPKVVRYRLSYARAQEMAPIVKRFLSPRGEVIYDARTNTLIIID